MLQSIKTTQDEHGTIWVSGRGMFAYMDISTKQNFVGFMRHRIKMLKLEAGKDYIELPHHREHDRAPMLIEFQLTLNAAIAVAEYSKSGKAVVYLQSLKTSKDEATPVNETAPQRFASESMLLPNAQAAPAPAKPLTPLQEALLKAAQLAEQPGLDENFNERLVVVESKLDTILTLFRSVAEGLFGPFATNPATVEPTEDIELVPTRIFLRLDSVRGQVIGLVNDYVSVHPEHTHHQVWRELYKRLNREYGIDISRHKDPKEESYLAAAERCGQLDNLFKVAVSALVDHPKPMASKLASTVTVTATPSLAKPEQATA